MLTIEMSILADAVLIYHLAKCPVCYGLKEFSSLCFSSRCHQAADRYRHEAENV